MGIMFDKIKNYVKAFSTQNQIYQRLCQRLGECKDIC